MDLISPQENILNKHPCTTYTVSPYLKFLYEKKKNLLPQLNLESLEHHHICLNTFIFTFCIPPPHTPTMYHGLNSHQRSSSFNGLPNIMITKFHPLDNGGVFQSPINIMLPFHLIRRPKFTHPYKTY